ncbi:MAG: acireductone dioxygenase [Acidobacteriota bacterium]
MAIVRLPAADRTLTDEKEIAAVLARSGVHHERWDTHPSSLGAGTPEAILDAYAAPIEALKRRGGHVTADVIDIVPDTPDLDALLARFAREHWHEEDEVRFVVAGSGLFFIHPASAPVISIETLPGDLLRVPRGTRHWFHLCPARRIRAIRLFQDRSGWAPVYTHSGIEQTFAPVCLGGPPAGGS